MKRYHLHMKYSEYWRKTLPLKERQQKWKKYHLHVKKPQQKMKRYHFHFKKPQLKRGKHHLNGWKYKKFDSRRACRPFLVGCYMRCYKFDIVSVLSKLKSHMAAVVFHKVERQKWMIHIDFSFSRYIFKSKMLILCWKLNVVIS